MKIFKIYINKMTYALIALFLFSFAIGAADKTYKSNSPDSDCDITKYFETTSNSESFDIRQFLISQPSSNTSAMVGGAAKPDFDIDIKKVSFKDKISENILKFCVGASPICIDPNLDIQLKGIKTKFFLEMEKSGTITPKDYQYILDSEELEMYTESIKDLDSPEEKISIWNQMITWPHFSKGLQQVDAPPSILNKRKGIAGEIAANTLFEHLGYKRFEEYYQHYREPLFRAEYQDGGGEVVYEQLHPYCSTQNRSNHGIDAIFIHRTESPQAHTHIIINESKCRDADDLTVSRHFNVLPKNSIRSHSWRQSRSVWNEYNFSNINDGCLQTKLGSYNQQTILRTATLLNMTGEIQLYQVKDAQENSYFDLSSFQKKYVKIILYNEVVTLNFYCVQRGR